MNRARRVWLGGAIFVLAALGAPVLAPYYTLVLSGPAQASPGTAHWLGTNDLGQDLWSQLLYGIRTSLLVAVGVTLLSTALSWIVGLVAGVSRPAESGLMFLADLLLALPSLPLYLLLITLIGPGLLPLTLILGLLSWPAFARMVRGIVIATRTAPYVTAAWALGATRLHVARHHLLPATLDVLPTKLILTMRFAIFTEATLAFLGLGDPTAISCGTMLSRAFDDPLLFSRPVWPWLIFPPTLAVTVLVLTTVWISRMRDSGRHFAS
jgi:ABC-type dipeptide/oligopeptide/nickel transport system permease subunit